MKEINIQSALYDSLARCAEGLRCQRLMEDTELASAFMGIGITIARNAMGDVEAASWLRDLADATESEVVGRKIN